MNAGCSSVLESRQGRQVEDVLKQAIAAHKVGNLEQAEQTYGEILAAEPDNTEALNALGILRMQIGSPEIALDCFERAAQLSPGAAKYHNNVGNVRMAQEKFDAALTAFERAASLTPENPEFMANAATACWRAGDSAEAEKLFLKVLTLDPGHYRANHNLGALLSQQHRLGDALPYLEKAARDPDCEVDALLNLATTYERLNRLEEATAVVDQIAETEHPRLRFLRARLLRRKGDAAAALDLLNEAPGGVDFEALGLEFAAEWCHELMLCADLEGKYELAYENLLAVKSYRRRAFGAMGENVFLEEVRRWRHVWTAPCCQGFPER